MRGRIARQAAEAEKKYEDGLRAQGVVMERERVRQKLEQMLARATAAKKAFGSEAVFMKAYGEEIALTELLAWLEPEE